MIQDKEIATHAIESYLIQLQDGVCCELEQEEPVQKFKEDLWQHSTGGGGKTRVLSGGQVFEKAGVNFSHVKGQVPPAIIQKRPELSDYLFEALGVSIVVHPLNPFVPTSHANVRFFKAWK